MSAVRVVLAGVHGFGRNYLPVLRELTTEGKAELAGLCDLRPADPGHLEGFGRPLQSADLAGLVRQSGAVLAIVATPQHTHVPLAVAAMRAGAHIQLEKPPAPAFSGYRELLEESGRLDRAVQVGFQSLGSAAPGRVREIVASGAIGRVRRISATAAWSRDTAYYQRAPWAGLRRLPDGTDVVDGALTNPLAHTVATVLAVDGGTITSLETELYRAFDIEADDTSCLRVVTEGGLSGGAPLLVAVTLAAPAQTPPVITVAGESGRITYWYTEDRVLLEREGQPPVETVEARTGLLRHLVEQLHRDPERTPRPLVPLTAVRSFMQVLEAVRTADEPVALAADELPGAAGARRRVLPGITELITAAGERAALFSEMPQFAAVAGRHP